MITATTIPLVPVVQLDDLFLDEKGRLKAAFDSAVFLTQPPDQLKLWCHLRARYGLPTRELIAWLRERIAGRSAIEIGSGNGDLGYLLGIPETDSFIQQSKVVRLLFRDMQQCPTNPPASVHRLDALKAIDRFHPKVVVASWFTRKFELGRDREGMAQASIYGAREEEIINRVETYIHIGNLDQHGAKTALRIPHKVFRFPWALSRAADQSRNVIYVWDKS